MPPRSDTVECPKDFDKQSKSIWRLTRRILVSDSRWRPEYSILLERYVRAIEVGRLARDRITARSNELEELRPAWEAELNQLITAGYKADDKLIKDVRRNLSRDAYTTFGSQGQLVQHPDLKTARDAERDANDYAKELVLTPAARAKGGEQDKPPVGKFGGALG